MELCNQIMKSMLFGTMLTLCAMGPVQAAEETPTASGDAICLIGAYSGVDLADAETSALLVCDELRAQGIAVGQPTADVGTATSAYRLSLRTLGDTVLVRLSHEEPVGTVKSSRRTQIRNISKIPTVAPRLAEALVKNTSIKSTARVANLVGKETRKYEKTPGEFFWGIGIVGLTIPGVDAVMQPGMDLRAFYERPRYSVGTNIRVAGGSGETDDAFFIGWGMGGRYFFSEKNNSFFAGGGVSWTTLSVSQGNWSSGEHFNGHESGFGAYAEIGMEFLRFHSSRMSIDLRVDAPMFSLKDNGQSKYFLPITLGVQYAW